MYHGVAVVDDYRWLEDSSNAEAKNWDFYQQIYFHKLGTPTADGRYEADRDFSRIAELHLVSDPSQIRTFTPEGKFLGIVPLEGVVSVSELVRTGEGVLITQ